MQKLIKRMSRLINRRRIEIVMRLFIVISTLLYTTNMIGYTSSTTYADEPPACHITANPGLTVYEGEEIILTEDGGAAVSWLWSTNETTQSIIVTASGNYEVTVTDKNGCEKTCDVDVTVYDNPECSIIGGKEIFEGETIKLCANEIAGASYSWTGPGGFTSTDRCIEVGVEGTYEVTVTDENGCESTCSSDPVIVKKPCECSLVVLKRDEDGHPIDGAVFEVNGVQKTITGGEARWGNLKCNTTYEVKEISPEEKTLSITLSDCGERSTLSVVNEGYLIVLPITGTSIPYSPFIGISTVLAGIVLYVLSKPKKKGGL